MGTIKQPITSGDHYQCLFDQAPIGMMYFDTSGTIQECNRAARQLTGSELETPIGRRAQDIARLVRQQDHTPMPDLVGQVLASGQPATLAEPGLLVVQDDREVPVTAFCSPIQDRNGGMVGAMLVLCDVTESCRR